MRSILLLIALPLIELHAAPVACVPGTLEDYLGVGSCQLGDRLLSAFSVLPLSAGSTEISTADIMITPAASGGAGSLVFTYNGSAAAGHALESSFGFRVTDAVRAPQFVSLRLLGATASGDASVNGIAELCEPGSPNPACSDTLVAFALEAVSGLSDRGTIGVSDFLVRQDVVIDGGLAGTASLLASELRFSTVPEPSTVLTLAAGLFAVSLLQRRLRR